MQTCTYGGMLDELLLRPVAELRLVGADDDGDDDDAGSDDDDNDGEDDDDDDDADADKSKSKSGSSKKPKLPTAQEWADASRRLANFDEERDRDKGKITKLNADLKAKDTEISKLKTDGVKDEEVKQENVSLKATNEKLAETNAQLQIKIAALGDTTYKWKNPATALKLMDTSNVEVDAKGQVTGLKAALDKLASTDAYLLAEDKSDKDDDEDDDKDRQPAPRRSGDAPGGRRPDRNQQKSAAKDNALRQRFPGLRR